MNTVVKKYGGATLATPERIKQIAQSLHEFHLRGDNLIVVVSAMGQTTNELIALANQVSQKPKRRELDMLLSTGERISMSLLSLALNDLNCPAISFTGSQAGILTDDSHLNAFITDLNSPRVKDALDQKRVVIIAGFQGVSPKSKEITTLGRGGSDTTAVALAAALKANHCEILKDVDGVYTADPKICSKAQRIPELSYQQMLEMTFWGAKVLHYRSVELAFQKKVSIYIGPAQNTMHGTWVTSKEQLMFESIQILSINSHQEVIEVQWGGESLGKGLQKLQEELYEKEISFPQLLSSEISPSGENLIFLTGPKEILSAIKRELKSFIIKKDSLCSVTATCSGVSTPEILNSITNHLEAHQIKPLRVWMSGMSCSILVESQKQNETIQLLHQLIHHPVIRK